MPIPTVLSVAGSDSSGGAGIQADIKTCQELGVYAATAITAITAQNTTGVQSWQGLDASLVRDQIEAVLSDIGVHVIKTGMLVHADIVTTVAELANTYRVANIVVDPVMASTSGTALLSAEGQQVLVQKLLPLATVFTPNLPETAMLLNKPECKTIAEMKAAAVQLHKMGPKLVILKGGHLRQGEAIDLCYDGQAFFELKAKRLDRKHTHGTGCTFASAIAAELAKGAKPIEAAKKAKAYVTAAISEGIPLGAGIGPTDHAAYRRLGQEGGCN
ncbi:bifunctional hydroxymethylpyrimidine kinase/phosphomethylpyrimidine kinase [Shouchella rhizosphaerae]|uniref:bifunctional hydroxymethylpyrimidine kinase/phosphomethylpyrimidine kinase n=1 Tax=Shouchella rhizosphaerae TaxID=866786 RepID=UPI0032563CEC